MTDFETTCRQLLQDQRLVSIKITGPDSQSTEAVKRIKVRPVQIRGEVRYQIARQVAKQERHENVLSDELVERLAEVFPAHFRECQVQSTDRDFHFQRRASGRVRATARAADRVAQVTPHDRNKRYLIPEGMPCPFLEDIGVMRADGKVRAAKFRKFRQINRFLELVADVKQHLPSQGALRIIDFGCGKSYLTFALHYFFTELLQRPVELIGLDRDPAVIQTCREVVDRLSLSGIEFRCGDIAEFAEQKQVDLVVSLHACDTATDAVLAQAIRWRPPVILSVPCCQHEIAGQVAHADLQPLLKHGILRERLGALVTDALRAAHLESHGYATQVLEFIDMEHTAKNLMLRAVLGNSTEDQTRANQQFERMRSALSIDRFSLVDR